MNDQVVTIEKTAKKWKRLQLIGALLTIVGTVFCAAAGASHASQPVAAGGTLLLFVGGLGLFICARIGAWWHHG